MRHNKLFYTVFILTLILFQHSFSGNAQINKNDHFSFNEAMELYETNNFIAAEKILTDLRAEAEEGDPLKFDYDFYRLMCLVKQNKRVAEPEITKYLTETKGSPWENQLWFEMARLQFNTRKYKLAARTFEKVEPLLLSKKDLQDFKFYMGYSNFEAGNLKKASQAFFDVKKGNSIYAKSASYYWGYINYLEGNYETALQEFLLLENNREFAGFIPFYTIQIYYLQNKYDLVIEKGPNILAGASNDQVNELNKIIGDAYYETANYFSAIKYLEAYQGVSGKKTREDFYRIAYCYYEAKEYKQAISGFEKTTVKNDTLAQNAYYLLGDCYLKIDQKQKAKAAFERASQFSFYPNIEEDALFNYAKLTYELSYSPFNETIRAFDQYIAKYPDSERNDAAFDYLVKVYMTTKNYRDAIRSIEKIKVKSPSVKEALQRVTYFRALELFNDGRYNESIKAFEKSLEHASYNRNYKALALYWSAEANYRLLRFDSAIEGFNAFQASPGAFSLNEFGEAYYSIGYCYFNQKNYDQSLTWFRKYLNQSRTSNSQKCDTYNRVADCYYIMRDYDEAMKYYVMSVELGEYDPDYALFQKASCHGLAKGYNQKIETLQTLVRSYQKSAFVDDALFEIAKTHERLQNFDQAIADYNTLIQQTPQSSYVKKAYLQMGLIYYNQSNNNNSLTSYKKVVENYPNTQEASAALTGIKNNYVDMNNVDGYFTYTSTLGDNMQVSSTAQDSIFYMAAEKNYMAGDAKAAQQFKQYLERYPNGSFKLNASFYFAESLYAQGKYSESMKLYEQVARSGNNIFSEQALIKAGELTLNAEKYREALEYFENLEKIANTKWNLLKARAGILRVFYATKKYQQTIDAAQELISTEKVTQLMVREASYKMAKSLYQLGEVEKALNAFKTLALDTKSAEGAEAKFMVAKILFERQQYDETEKEVNNFLEMGTDHQYWLAKAIVLTADVYLASNDLFQARHTLKSIVENYPNKEDGIVDEALQKIAIIKAREEESILNDTPQIKNDSILNQ